jgi:hypothetical protein
VEALEDRALPATLVPTTFADGETIGGTLRAAVIVANANGEDNVISLRAGTYSLAVPNTSGQENAAGRGDLDLTANGHTLVIEGRGAGVTVIDGDLPGLALDDRLFQIMPGVTVVFRNLTLRGGRARDGGTAGRQPGESDSRGGGILNAGTLKLEDVVLEHCKAEGGIGASGTAANVHGFNGLRAFGGGIFNSGTVELLRSTLRYNTAIGGAGGLSAPTGGYGGFGELGVGGGLAMSEGTALLVSSTVAMNLASGGSGGNGESGGGNGGDGLGGGLAAMGGVFTPEGVLTLINTTVSSNQAREGQGGQPNGPGASRGTPGSATGGGIYAWTQLKLYNSTVAANTAFSAQVDLTGQGGGVYAASGHGSAFISVSSLIAGNTADSDPDVRGTFDVVEYTLLGRGQGTLGILHGVNGNLVGVSAQLGPLTDNGGPTWTHALLAGSPARDAGANPDGLEGDQRGFGPRTVNGVADIGAFELDATPSLPPPPPTDDFGDAPTPFPTLLANNGARHRIVPGFHLGGTVDAEADGQPHPFSAGDDLPGSPDDEDGVVFTTALTAGRQAGVTVTASQPGLLHAWIDFNNDGDWDDAGEQVFTNRVLAAGPNALTFAVPAAAVPGTRGTARFRFSTQADLQPTGPAPDGEVEDRTVAINVAPPPDQSAGPVVLLRGGRPKAVWLGYPRGSRLFRQRVVLTNINRETLTGRYRLVLAGDMTLVRARGQGAQVTWQDGHTLLMDFGSAGLPPGSEMTLVLMFRQPGGGAKPRGTYPLVR